jgi:hypothetical protein
MPQTLHFERAENWEEHLKGVQNGNQQALVDRDAVHSSEIKVLKKGFRDDFAQVKAMYSKDIADKLKTRAEVHAMELESLRIDNAAQLKELEARRSAADSASEMLRVLREERRELKKQLMEAQAAQAAQAAGSGMTEEQPLAVKLAQALAQVGALQADKDRELQTRAEVHAMELGALRAALEALQTEHSLCGPRCKEAVEKAVAEQAVERDGKAKKEKEKPKKGDKGVTKGGGSSTDGAGNAGAHKAAAAAAEAQRDDAEAALGKLEKKLKQSQLALARSKAETAAAVEATAKVETAAELRVKAAKAQALAEEEGRRRRETEGQKAGGAAAEAARALRSSDPVTDVRSGGIGGAKKLARAANKGSTSASLLDKPSWLSKDGPAAALGAGTMAAQFGARRGSGAALLQQEGAMRFVQPPAPSARKSTAKAARQSGNGIGQAQSQSRV